ncbi:ATP-binding protein [Sphingomonas psychrotolerans]|uniref:histidine kinase n=1 Tax=Sphingomonas psychrotolerans TaxID=1327635 RepID=A0ABU3N3C7_9SPHN|nr:ATP-binding protein [Sphingomonas psychrotolerans]MDT8758771.1 ATP-binding protein [Sphingomonas psychrotolerans]
MALRDHLRNEVDCDVILGQTSERLGRHFGANRVGYMEFDDSTVEMVGRGHWTDGTVVEITGRVSFEAFGEALTSSHRRGEIWIQKSLDNPNLDAEGRAACATYDIVAAITVPLIKNDKLVSILSVQHKVERDWSPADIDLIAEVAERTWATLERAKAESARRESDALLAAIMEHAPIGIFLKDFEGRYVLANPAVAQRLGRPQQEIIGRTAAELFDREKADRCEQMDQAVLRHGTVQVAEQQIDAEGSVALGIRFPVRTGDSPMRVAGVDLDITALKRAEQELERSREALFQSEKLNALGSLLAGVSHELNNPLAIILAQAELLEREVGGTAAAKRTGKIRSAAERAARIVQTFLAMARQRSPQRAPVGINDVVNAALDLTEFSLRSSGVQLERKLAADLPVIMADADQLHQVIVNLIINAQQAMDGQSTPRRLTIATGFDADPGMLRIEIADNGPGIPPELRRRIFEPFFTTKPQDEGTGVGLSFSQGLVEAHGGRLEVAPSSKGATLAIHLPITAPIEIGDAEELASATRMDGRTALVVDDECDIAEALADLLQLEGYRCTVATGGLAAQQWLRTGGFDLIITDLRMPDLDGSALFGWLQRTRPELLNAFAFSTGDRLSPSALRFLARVDRPVLEKPFTRAALQQLLRKMEPATLGSPS